MKTRIDFDICKSYFFILPSIQIITSEIHPYPTGFMCAVKIDWLCFHLSISLARKQSKGKHKKGADRMKCEDCIEWEYFEGYGYGCFCMKTMIPIDADKCEFYADKRPDVPHSWKPSKIESQESKEE